MMNTVKFWEETYAGEHFFGKEGDKAKRQFKQAIKKSGFFKGQWERKGGMYQVETSRGVWKLSLESDTTYKKSGRLRLPEQTSYEKKVILSFRKKGKIEWGNNFEVTLMPCRAKGENQETREKMKQGKQKIETFVEITFGILDPEWN